ncbi:MAG: asparagine synthetase A [Candidatus Bathyarchaeota archaeon]|nr:asparagine synthetase A [Candidatus Bathyarchaeota archaeon]MDI6805165.1 asparagine synthetase A [Candidatus Bathyarchaeia archaeon]
MTKRQNLLTIAEERLIGVPKPLEQLSKSELQRKQSIGKVMTHVLKYLTEEFVKDGFEWLLPVIFSKSTDPLWPDPEASIDKRVEIEIYGEIVRANLSMIVQKMVASSLIHPKLFTLSPNIRIEKAERANTGIHAYEFTQLDFEMSDATSDEVRSFVERVLVGLIRHLRDNVREDLTYLHRYNGLTVPKTPFKIYDRKELEKSYGKAWEKRLLKEIKHPVWITNIPREFYDFEDFESGTWDNYDLLLPKYGEALSGGRREWEYKKIVKKMERDKVKKENYRILLQLAKEGKLQPSAGAGLGVERLVAWIVGAKHIGETQPFPRVPGLVYDL